MGREQIDQRLEIGQPQEQLDLRVRARAFRAWFEGMAFFGNDSRVRVSDRCTKGIEPPFKVGTSFPGSIESGKTRENG